MKQILLLLLSIFLLSTNLCLSFSNGDHIIFANPKAPAHWKIISNSNLNDFIKFKILLKQNNLDKLNYYFEQVSNPKSEMYGEFLKSIEINEITRSDGSHFENVIKYLNQNGIDENEITLFSDYIAVETTIGKVESMTRSKFSIYENMLNGNIRNRLNGPAYLPNYIMESIDFIAGLSEFMDHNKNNLVKPYYEYYEYGNKYTPANDILVTPDVLKKYYNVPAGSRGVAPDNKIGIIAFNDYFSMGALAQFDELYNISPPNVTRNGTDCFGFGCDQYESDLDIQYITAMGEGIPTDFIAHLDGEWILDYLLTVMSVEQPPLVHSISYGWSELQQCDVATEQCGTYGYNSVQYVTRTNVEFQKIGTMGITVLVSDGDDGAPSLGGASGNCPLDQFVYCPTGCTHQTSQCGELTVSNGTEQCFYPMGVGSNACTNILPKSQAAMDEFVNKNSECSITIDYDRSQLPHVYSSCTCDQLTSVTVDGYTVSPYTFNQNNGAIFTAEFPASSPFVTSVGATQFISGASGEIEQEVACSILNGAKITTGGGFSSFQQQPSYQADAVNQYLQNNPNILPPSYSYNPSMRAYPEIVFNGHNYNIFASINNVTLDTCPCHSLPVDGTSCSTPALAGLLGLINDILLQHGKSQLGFLNPLLYQAYADDPSIFMDVTSGNNRCNRSYCCLYGWSASEGFDPISGMGSPNYELLLQYILKVKGVSL